MKRITHSLGTTWEARKNGRLYKIIYKIKAAGYPKLPMYHISITKENGENIDMDFWKHYTCLDSIRLAMRYCRNVYYDELTFKKVKIGGEENDNKNMAK